MPISAILAALSLVNAALPAIESIVAHYMELKNDGKLSETDLAKMKENLLGLQLRNKEDL